MAISEAIELSGGKIMKALVNSGKEFELEPEKSWEPVKNFRKTLAQLDFMIDHSGYCVGNLCVFF